MKKLINNHVQLATTYANTEFTEGPIIVLLCIDILIILE